MSKRDRLEGFLAGALVSTFGDAINIWSKTAIIGAAAGAAFSVFGGELYSNIFLGAKIGLFAGTLFGVGFNHFAAAHPDMQADEETGTDFMPLNEGAKTASIISASLAGYWIAHPFIS